MMWLQKKHSHVLYVDKRIVQKGDFEIRKNFEVKPDVQADFRKLPFDNDSFNLVVFDPPHTIRDKEEGGYIAMRYGRLTLKTWERDIALGLSECWRVLAEKGVLIFKWAETDKRIEDLQSFFPGPPLFGSRLGTKNKTLWIVFMKIPK